MVKVLGRPFGRDIVASLDSQQKPGMETVGRPVVVAEGGHCQLIPATCHFLGGATIPCLAKFPHEIFPAMAPSLALQLAERLRMQKLEDGNYQTTGLLPEALPDQDLEWLQNLYAGNLVAASVVNEYLAYSHIAVQAGKSEGGKLAGLVPQVFGLRMQMGKDGMCRMGLLMESLEVGFGLNSYVQQLFHDRLKFHSHEEPSSKLDMVLDQLAQISEGLAEAGVSHNDLKAENIMVILDEFGNPQLKLLDFGMALKLGEQSILSHALYSPFLSAPEAIIDARDVAGQDTFSLGILLISVLTNFGAIHPRAMQTIRPDAMGRYDRKQLAAAASPDNHFHIGMDVFNLLRVNLGLTYETAAYVTKWLDGLTAYLPEERPNAAYAIREIARLVREAKGF